MPIVYGNCGHCCPGGGGGSNIKSVYIDDDGFLIFVYEDDTEANVGRVFSEEQNEVINNAITPATLGDGFDVDEDGKVVMKAVIKVGDTDIPLEDGAFTIPAAAADQAGLVKLSDNFEVDEDGKLTVVKIPMSSLYEDDDDELILGG